MRAKINQGAPNVFKPVILWTMVILRNTEPDFESGAVPRVAEWSTS